MKSYWMVHKGVRVFIVNLSSFGADAEGVKLECDAIAQVLKQEPDHSVLAVTNVSGTFANEDILRALVALVPLTNQFVKRRAIVGVGGFRQHFLYAFSHLVGEKHFLVCDSMPEALEKLTSPQP